MSKVAKADDCEKPPKRKERSELAINGSAGIPEFGLEADQTFALQKARVLVSMSRCEARSSEPQIQVAEVFRLDPQNELPVSIEPSDIPPERGKENSELK